jgi:hypothetical protein
VKSYDPSDEKDVTIVQERQSKKDALRREKSNRCPQQSKDCSCIGNREEKSRMAKKIAAFSRCSKK